MTTCAILTSKKCTQMLRKKLEDCHGFDDKYSVTPIDDTAAIPIKENILCDLVQSFEFPSSEKDKLIKSSPSESLLKTLDNENFIYQGIECQFATVRCHLSKKSRVKTKHTELVENIFNFLLSKGFDLKLHKELTEDIPDHWEKHGDLVLLPEKAFLDPSWKVHESQVLKVVAETLDCKRVARKSTISNDGFRTPQVDILLGDNGWVQHVDNGIKYHYDVTKCMFSAGNISEKLRVASFDCRGKTVVDLYAGIGYFTLPYLVYARADFVHACEWNPNAVDALEKNLKANGVDNRCKIYFGDNREVCPINVADEVNLGLIPSSQESWKVACKALKHESGGILHIHDNVTSSVQKTDSPIKNIIDNLSESDLEFCSEQFIEKSRIKLKKTEWLTWAIETAKTFRTILTELHSENWSIKILHVENLKSYAPHINNLVLDLECKPLKRS